ncbi:hypothetical protein AAY473_039347 [Plecturocebus cupreus]
MGKDLNKHFSKEDMQMANSYKLCNWCPRRDSLEFTRRGGERINIRGNPDCGESDCPSSPPERNSGDLKEKEKQTPEQHGETLDIDISPFRTENTKAKLWYCPSNWEIPDRGATRVASTTLLAGVAVLPVPPARRFPERSIRDGRARLVPSPQGKQQLEALRTESFTASTENPGRSSSVGNRHPPKEN